MGAYVYLPPEQSKGARKIDMIEILQKTANYIHLGLNAAKNNDYTEKRFK